MFHVINVYLKKFRHILKVFFNENSSPWRLSDPSKIKRDERLKNLHILKWKPI